MTRRATRDAQAAPTGASALQIPATKASTAGAVASGGDDQQRGSVQEAPAPRTGLASFPPNDALGLIPAAAFAALVGRTLRTLRAWDQAGLIHPVMIRRRRYYRASDVASLVAHGDSRRGPRVGSPIKYLEADWDNGI